MSTARYDMPAQFGPSLIPDQSHASLGEVAAISFETTPEAASLLPRHFELGPKPIVTVSRIDYHGLEYLGGRGYREVVVSVDAIHRGRTGDARAGFGAVMWVSEVPALVSGREYMGFGKLYGEMQPLERSGDTVRFGLAEYGAALIEGEVSGLAEIAGDTLEKLRRSAEEVRTFGWKYIPGPEGSVDADYALVNLMRWNYRRAWSGVGSLRFFTPDYASAPMSSRILRRLADLPVVSYGRAFVGEGSAIIDRAATRRLIGRD